MESRASQGSLVEPRREFGNWLTLPDNTPTPRQDMEFVNNCIQGEIVIGEKFTLLRNSVCEHIWSESHFRLVCSRVPKSVTSNICSNNKENTF